MVSISSADSLSAGCDGDVTAAAIGRKQAAVTNPDAQPRRLSRCMAFISVTRLHLRSWRFFPSFVIYTLASARQIRGVDGFIDGYLAGDPDRGAWTVTVWREEAAMQAYRSTGAHMKAMPKLLTWCDEASIAHWTQEDASTPPPEVAFERMRRQGRISKVKSPSAKHQRGDVVGQGPPRAARKLRRS